MMINPKRITIGLKMKVKGSGKIITVRGILKEIIDGKVQHILTFDEGGGAYTTSLERNQVELIKK